MIEFDTRKHGAVPFWFWNGDQQESEITRQLELAAKGGLKGMAIHARTGNKTEYMSDRWLELVRHSCKEAIRLSLDIWLYDEEGFPSGTVGHRLQKDEPRYQQKVLAYDYCTGARLAEADNVVAVYDAGSFERIATEEVKADMDVLVFRMSYVPRYIDALKRETAERFMDMTHRMYFDALGAYFGSPITHIYTDDLNSYLDHEATLAYTECLPEIFEERLGYRLLENLPKLIETLPGSEKVRIDYRGIVMDLFLNEFVAPMHRWCDEHGVLFTGHLSGDEGEITKSAHRFGAAMPFYEHEHIPGVDDFLCAVSSGCYLYQLRNRHNHCPVIVFKQASSVANQLKDGLCSSECLTFLGWGASVWGQSAFLNYELALGVNLLTHHDFSYATGGVAKRDCPPSYFFQQPYWRQYKLFHDAMARSMQLLKRGTYAASTLIIHPMSSCWAALDGRGYQNTFNIQTESALPDPLKLEESLAAVSHELLKMRVGFEYGDEWLLAKHGGVEDGALRMGRMSYSTVIIPEVSNMLASTVALLETFQAAGGRVIAVNPSPDCLLDGACPERAVFGNGVEKESRSNNQQRTSNVQVDCRLSPEAVSSPEELRECVLAPTIELNVAEAGAPVICHTREVDGLREHFVYNVSDRPQAIAWRGALHAYDPVGNVGILRSTDTRLAGATEGNLVLPPFRAVHLLPELPAGILSLSVEQSLFSEAAGGSVEIEEASWRVVPEQPNLMLIDWCELADGGTVYFDDKDQKQASECECRVTIEIPDPSCVTAVVGEARTLREMRINGSPLPPARGFHPSSQDMLVTELDGLLIAGRNEFTFTGPDEYCLFEPFYLIGNFGVNLVETDLGMRPVFSDTKPAFGDLAECGLPFYWGGVRYETEISGDCGAEWLDCGEIDGVVELSVNGKEVGCRYMAPYRFRIADCLMDGENSIVLTLFNTAQNLYGPHRREQGVALHRCERRGVGKAGYFIAKFGVTSPPKVV